MRPERAAKLLTASAAVECIHYAYITSHGHHISAHRHQWRLCTSVGASRQQAGSACWGLRLQHGPQSAAAPGSVGQKGHFGMADCSSSGRQAAHTDAAAAAALDNIATGDGECH